MSEMPARPVHIRLDKMLTEEGIILPETIEKGINEDVHTLMDSGVVIYGPEHQEKDRTHSVREIRDYLRTESPWKSLDQDTKTDIVRIVAFHQVLDEEKWKYPNASDDALLRMAKALGIRRRLHTKYFRP